LKQIERFVEKICLFVNLVNPIEKINFVKEDPDDNAVLECAVKS
jgi:hypothetical protein